MSKQKVSVCLEFAGMQYPVAEIEKCIKECVKARHPEITVKEIGIYMQPETNFVYYTLNGEGGQDYSISFDEILMPA